MQRTKFFGFLFGAVLALSAVMPASATILYAGGEDVDFVVSGVVTVTTSGGVFRTGYAREALVADISSGDPPTNIIQLPAAFANQSTIWVHFESFNSTGNNNTVNNQYIGIYGSDGVRRLLVRGTGTNGQVKITKSDTARTMTDLCTATSGAWPLVALTNVDIFVNYAVAGQVTMYVNGVQTCNFTGDVTTNSITSVNRVDFASAGATTTNKTNWSEVIVSDSDTRSLNLFTCAPQANGVNMMWIGSFANVNGTTANDATPLSTGSNNQTAEFTCPALPAGSFTVPAVVQVGRVLKGASGPANFRFIARPSSGSTDFDSGSDIPVTTNFANYRNIWATNPACSCAWTTPDVTTGVNFGVVSKP